MDGWVDGQMMDGWVLGGERLQLEASVSALPAASC